MMRPVWAVLVILVALVLGVLVALTLRDALTELLTGLGALLMQVAR